MRGMLAILGAWVCFNTTDTFSDWTDGIDEMRCPLGVSPPHASCQRIVIIGAQVAP